MIDHGNNTKLTVEQVREIRASTEPNTVLAKRYGVGARAIMNIRHGITWGKVK